MAKHAVVEEKKKLGWQTRPITVWRESTGKFEYLPLDLCVEVTRDEWDFVDYDISSSFYDEDPVGIKAMMKKLGYYPIPSNSKTAQSFQHYTKKQKVTP